MAGLMVNSATALTKPTSETTDKLNPRESVDFREHRKQLFWWLANFGKDPARAEGYAEETLRTRGYLIDEFYRWVWDIENTYITWASHDHADDWVAELAISKNGNSYKNNSIKAVRMLFKYQHHIHGTEEWQPPFRFHEKGTKPRDYLTTEERRKIRDASLAYGSVRTMGPWRRTPGTNGTSTLHNGSRSPKTTWELQTGSARTAGRFRRWCRYRWIAACGLSRSSVRW